MDTSAWPAPLTLVLADSELGRAWQSGDEACLELASAQVQWPVSTRRQPQQGWVWPLRLRWHGVQDWQAAGLLQGRIATALLWLDEQPLVPVLPARHVGRLRLQLALAQGGWLRLQAQALHIGLEGAQLRESTAC